MIFLDGCHIKTRYRGQLLTAVGIDSNDCISPIAVVVVEVEDKPNWCWFLERLKNDLGIIYLLFIRHNSPWGGVHDA